MEKILFIIVLSLSLPLCAQARVNKNSQYIKCLAQEELRIHKRKESSAYAELNKSLISEVILLSPTVAMNQNLEKILCSKTNKTPSYDLLGNLLVGVKVFHTTAHFRDIQRVALDTNSINNIRKKVNYIFIRFITNLQTNTKHAYCLQKKFPQIRDLLYKAQYTLENVGMNQLKSEIVGIKELFKKLKKPNALADC